MEDKVVEIQYTESRPERCEKISFDWHTDNLFWIVVQEWRNTFRSSAFIPEEEICLGLIDVRNQQHREAIRNLRDVFTAICREFGIE